MLLKEIAITNDKMRFLQRMISKLLMNQDLHFPSVYGTVDEKAQATTYFIADYIDTIDIDHALWIYRGVTLLTDLQSNFWINRKYYSRYGIPVRPKND